MTEEVFSGLVSKAKVDLLERQKQMALEEEQRQKQLVNTIL